MPRDMAKFRWLRTTWSASTTSASLRREFSSVRWNGRGIFQVSQSFKSRTKWLSYGLSGPNSLCWMQRNATCHSISHPSSLPRGCMPAPWPQTGWWLLWTTSESSKNRSRSWRLCMWTPLSLAAWKLSHFSRQVILCAAIWIPPNKIFNIPNFRRHRSHRCIGGGAVAGEVPVRPGGVLQDAVPQPAHQVREAFAATPVIKDSVSFCDRTAVFREVGRQDTHRNLDKGHASLG